MAEALNLLLAAVLLLSLVHPVMAADEEIPSTELLEFLGEWETKEGEWFNPMWILKNLSAKKQNDDSGAEEVTDDE